jgi:hypothetical protein
MSLEFVEFPKIPRYRREVALTEKLDGTNAAIVWAQPDVGDSPEACASIIARMDLTDQHGTELGSYCLLAQSRNRHITPGKDNYGFAKFVAEHADDLKTLGPGVHAGEWWGNGIQRGYDLTPGDKRFSLFNVNRWGEGRQTPPACCSVVPLLGYFTPDNINTMVEGLRSHGSLAAPGYMNPEGVIVWHSQSKQYYKILLEGDDTPKSLQK